MVLINYATKEIVAKIVYYGPGLCGKTTNLQHIYAKLNPKKRGKMISLATEADRTLFFDFLPVEFGVVQGFKVRFQLYTVPGQVFYDATRRLVLKGADALVFVADSQADVMSKNLESLEDMKRNLVENGLDPSAIPIVFQYNKRDLPNLVDIKILDNNINYRNAPSHPATAINGAGVMETFKEIIRQLIFDMKKKHSLMDAGISGELPNEVFEPKLEPEPAREPEFEIELGSAIREEGADEDVTAGSMLDMIETISLADKMQAEAFFDSVRSGSPAEEAKHKAEVVAAKEEKEEVRPETTEPVGVVPEEMPGVELSGIISVLERLEGQVASLRKELRSLKEARESEAIPHGGGIEEAAQRLEKFMRDVMEGQDRLLLSILESVRDAKKSSVDSNERIEGALSYLADKIKDGSKTRKWF